MDYKKKLEIGYMDDIIDCIQEKVNKLALNLYEDDKCYPVFKVSVLWKNQTTQEVILNCTHLGRTFSRVLFPREECFFEYDSLGDVIVGLYNQTM